MSTLTVAQGSVPAHVSADILKVEVTSANSKLPDGFKNWLPVKYNVFRIVFKTESIFKEFSIIPSGWLKYIDYCTVEPKNRSVTLYVNSERGGHRSAFTKDLFTVLQRALDFPYFEDNTHKDFEFDVRAIPEHIVADVEDIREFQTRRTDRGDSGLFTVYQVNFKTPSIFAQFVIPDSWLQESDYYAVGPSSVSLYRRKRGYDSSYRDLSQLSQPSCLKLKLADRLREDLKHKWWFDEPGDKVDMNTTRVGTPIDRRPMFFHLYKA